MNVCFFLLVLLFWGVSVAWMHVLFLAGKRRNDYWSLSLVAEQHSFIQTSFHVHHKPSVHLDDQSSSDLQQEHCHSCKQFEFLMQVANVKRRFAIFGFKMYIYSKEMLSEHVFIHNFIHSQCKKISFLE